MQHIDQRSLNGVRAACCPINRYLLHSTVADEALENARFAELIGSIQGAVGLRHPAYDALIAPPWRYGHSQAAGSRA